MSNHRFSRFLTAILRHRAPEMGYHMDVTGFVPVSEILTKCDNVTLEQIQQIIKEDQKQRFELVNRQDQWYIRAVQGHSIPGINPDLRLVEDATEIPVVVHGTNVMAYEFIKEQGLNKMTRNHIHFASGPPDDPRVISGIRKNTKVLIYIDAAKAMADGIKFYLSSNGVILSEGIDGIISPHYFSKIEIL